MVATASRVLRVAEVREESLHEGRGRIATTVSLSQIETCLRVVVIICAPSHAASITAEGVGLRKVCPVAIVVSSFSSLSVEGRGPSGGQKQVREIPTGLTAFILRGFGTALALLGKGGNGGVSLVLLSGRALSTTVFSITAPKVVGVTIDERRVCIITREEICWEGGHAKGLATN